MEKNINIQKAIFFSFLKKNKPIKEKFVKISYLIMVRRYGLAFKYKNFSKYRYILRCRIALSDISGIAFS